MNIYNEGFGTLYERIVRKAYLREIIPNNAFEDVLEIKSGFGIDSRVYSDKKVTLADNRREYVLACKDTWNGDSCNIMMMDMELLPFKKNSFDLIWSSCVLDEIKRPRDYILKLKDITRQYLLLFASNDLHFTHLAKKIGKKRFRFDEWTMNDLFKSCGFEILDCGGIDSPPWPSGFCIPSGKRKSDSRKINSSKILAKIARFEKILPRPIKVFSSHQVYVFARKIKQENF